MPVGPGRSSRPFRQQQSFVARPIDYARIADNNSKVAKFQAEESHESSDCRMCGTACHPSAICKRGAVAQERTVKITGFGAKSGVVRVFGINSEAALKAAAEEINKAGGVTLGDG